MRDTDTKENSNGYRRLEGAFLTAQVILMAGDKQLLLFILSSPNKGRATIKVELDDKSQRQYWDFLEAKCENTLMATKQI